MQADCLAEPKKVTGASSADQCLFGGPVRCNACFDGQMLVLDRKSTRLNSSHLVISYAVFCLKKKTFLALHRQMNRMFDNLFPWFRPANEQYPRLVGRGSDPLEPDPEHACSASCPVETGCTYR